ncbi:MAG: hypothetical protein AAF629_12240 [Chloroflexota bacterium]
MFSYTHLVVANRLLSRFSVENEAEYYLGALIPDIRYLSDVPRDQTHFRAKDLLPYFERYPELQSFMTGYFVHCLIDDLEYGLNIGLLKRFPLAPFRRFLRTRYASIILELYCVESIDVSCRLAETSNDFLRQLAIPDHDVVLFAQQLNDFLKCPDFDRQLALAQSVGVQIPTRFDRYARFYKAIKRRPIWLALLFKGLRMQSYIHWMLEQLTARPAYITFQQEVSLTQNLVEVTIPTRK